MNAIRSIGKMGMDAALNGAEAVVDAGGVVFTVADMAAASAQGVSIGERARAIASNKYVIGGVAAVAVAGLAYGTYRMLKKKDAPVAPAAALTAEQKVDKANGLLKEAQGELANAGKQAVAA